MHNPFQILSEFLERFGCEVQGRGLETLPAEVRQRLQEFAQGQLGEQGRADLAAFLKDQPQWVEHLAAEIKSCRPKSKPGD